MSATHAETCNGRRVAHHDDVLSHAVRGAPTSHVAEVGGRGRDRDVMPAVVLRPIACHNRHVLTSGSLLFFGRPRPRCVPLAILSDFFRFRYARTRSVLDLRRFASRAAAASPISFLCFCGRMMWPMP